MLIKKIKKFQINTEQNDVLIFPTTPSRLRVYRHSLEEKHKLRASEKISSSRVTLPSLSLFALKCELKTAVQ